MSMLQIDHEEVINGLVYRSIREDEVDMAVDFYFDVFLKGFRAKKDTNCYCKELISSVW